MKSSGKKFVMIVEKTVTGFSAFSDDYPVFTTGKTIPELIDNAYEAVNLCFEDEKIAITREDLKFEIDPNQENEWNSIEKQPFHC